MVTKICEFSFLQKQLQFNVVVFSIWLVSDISELRQLHGKQGNREY